MVVDYLDWMQQARSRGVRDTFYIAHHLGLRLLCDCTRAREECEAAVQRDRIAQKKCTILCFNCGIV